MKLIAVGLSWIISNTLYGDSKKTLWEKKTLFKVGRCKQTTLALTWSHEAANFDWKEILFYNYIFI